MKKLTICTRIYDYLAGEYINRRVSINVTAEQAEVLKSINWSDFTTNDKDIYDLDLESNINNPEELKIVNDCFIEDEEDNTIGGISSI